MLPIANHASLAPGPLLHQDIVGGLGNLCSQVVIVGRNGGDLSLKLHTVAFEAARIGHAPIQVAQNQHGDHDHDQEPCPR